MKYFVCILSFLFVSVFSTAAIIVPTCTISGPADVCENQTAIYSVTAYANHTYTWNATGGGTVIGSGATVTVAWTTAGSGTVTIVIKDSLNNVVCTNIKNVVIHGKPNPVITPSFIAGCGATQGHSAGNPKGDGGCLVACDSSFIKYTTPLHSGSTYVWTITGPGTSTSTGNIATVFWTNVGVGIVKVKEINQWGCEKEVQVCIEIVGKPKAKFTTLPNLNACKNQIIQFINQSVPGAGSSIASYSWYFGDGGTDFINAPSLGNSSYAYSTPGTYTVMLVVENECHCKDTAYATMTIASDPGPEIFCVSTVCPGTTVTYHSNTNGCGNYLWSVVNGTPLGSLTDSTISIQWGSTGPGQLTLSVNCPGFCNSPTTVFVPIITPTATIQGPANVCIGECYTYEISCDIPIDNIKWSFPIGVVVTTDSINVHQVQVCFYSAVTGNISATYFHNTPGSTPSLSCGGSTKLTVSVKPKMFVSGGTAICDKKNYSFGVSPSTGGNILWTIQNMSGTTLASATLLSSAPFTGIWTYGPGNFVITANDPGGFYCNGPQKFNFTVNPIPPKADTIMGPLFICPNNSYSYIGVPTSASYSLVWQVTNGTPTIGVGNSISITWGPTGPYSLVAAQINPVSGCRSDTIKLNINSLLPLTASPIVGSLAVCANSNVNYSTPAIGDNYEWSINTPLAGSISTGQGTQNVSVQWNNYTGSAYLILKRTVCGSSQKDSVIITVSPLVPLVVTAPPIVCQGVAAPVSSSGAAAYSWNFGDGSPTASGSSANHVYNAPGNYVITLTATYGGSCPGSAITTTSISVKPKPNINISTPDPNVYCNPPTIATNMYVAAPVFGTTYQWYNPSLIVSATSASYLAIATGSYSVVATNSYGCTNTSNVIPVTTSNCTPVNCTPAAYSLDFNRYRLGCNTDSFRVVASTGVINFTWNFDDIYNPGIGSGTPINHTFTEPGYYRVTLCADVPNASGTGYCQICIMKVDTILYVPDFYAATFCQNLSNSVQVQLMNTTKVLTGHPTPSWGWLINPGAYTSNLQNPITNLTPGTYSVSLTVGGVCTFTKNIIINALPNASFTLLDSVCIGQPIVFQNTSTGIFNSSNWNFGDGASSLITSPVRNYSTAGLYTVVLTIMNALGCSDTANQKVLVRPNTLSGSISASGPIKFCEGDSVKLTVSASGGYPAYNYLWSTTQTTTSIQALQTGTYNVEIKDTLGCFYKTSNINVLVDPKPKPVITGSKILCINNQYDYYVNYPNVTGTTFTWTLDGVPYSNAASMTYFPSFSNIGTHTIQVTIVSAESCVGTDSIKITVFPNPNLNVATTGSMCAGSVNILVATSTSPNLVGFFWSNGVNNDSLVTGLANTYTVTAIDSNGCKEQQTVVVNPIPDLCGLMTGCYDICDTVKKLVWVAPSGYASYQWYLNGNVLPWAINDTIHIPLYTSGIYTVMVKSAAGCSVLSDPIDIKFIKCRGCEFNLTAKATCGPISQWGYQTYNMTFTLNNTLGAGTLLNIVSPNGSVYNVSPAALAAGLNIVTAIFEDLPAPDAVACFNLILVNEEKPAKRCDSTICVQLPKCDESPCRIISKTLNSIKCNGTDGSGNPQFQLCLDVNWGGSNGSTLTLGTTSGSFTPNPVTINNGLQTLCYTYTDFAPYSNGMLMYTYVYDPVTGKTCKDSMKVDTQACTDTCVLKINEAKVVCAKQVGGNWTYIITMSVFNPFVMYATVSISPIAAGTFGSITPGAVVPGTSSISFVFTDVAPANASICFKVMLMDSETDMGCWKTICLDLPKCGVVTAVLKNTAASFSMSVSPNPASNEVTINYDIPNYEGTLNFDVFDMYGKMVHSVSKKSGESQESFNTSEFAGGVYFIRVSKQNVHLGTTKLIIIK